MKRLLLSTLVLFTIIATQAQTNFSGTWKLKEKQHISGPEYSNALATDIIVRQTADSLITETVSAGTDGQEVRSRSSVPLNGKAVSSTSVQSARKVTRSISWSPDKKTLTLTSHIYKAGDENEVELTRIDTWGLSPDGKQLLINRKSVETVSENWEARGTFDKQ